ncbi:substrate-binding domain-containing protein [soil metagenome]|nr:LacI family DNA-binding transcriptional regulator [Trueperaceae bacterium]
MAKKPSVREVAIRAGVGTSTVSRTLNDHPNVSDDARERVLRAIAELGYTPNLSARSFRTGQTNAASVLLPMTGPEFYTRLLESIQRVLEREGYDTALFPVVGGIRLKRYRDASALPYHADGLIIASLDPDRIYDGERPPFNKPVVLVDTHHSDYHSVHFDNLAAGRMAAAHALKLSRPIVFVDVQDDPGDFESPVFAERREGVLQELRRHGIAPWRQVKLPISIEHGRRAAVHVREALADEPVTVLAACDDLALGVMRQLAETGVAVGRDVAVIGFDDGSAALANDLTTVRQPIEEMGAAAAEVLLQALAGALTEMEQIAFAPTLIERGSTRVGG